MAPDCLEKLVTALECHPTVDLAHCKLRTIDPEGRAVSDPSWPECTVFAHGTVDLVDRRHLRRAPYDGMLHLTGRSVYCSITELLIRRSLFDRVGYFESRWGSIGDVNWNMKASLVSDTVHVPDTWASYRVHPSQATAAVNFHSGEYAAKVEEMIQDAFQKCERLLAPWVAQGLKSYWLPLSKDMRRYYAELRNRRETLDRRVFQAARMLSGPHAIRAEVVRRFAGRPRWTDIVPVHIRRWLESLGHESVIIAD
jgi:hypothetical protein